MLEQDPQRRYRCRTCRVVISSTSVVLGLPIAADGIPEGECFRCAAPQLHDQLEEVLDAVWKAEENWRFDDFLEIATGGRRWLKSVAHHCDPPKNVAEDPCYREWRCECGQRWVKPGWYSAYQPVSG